MVRHRHARLSRRRSSPRPRSSRPARASSITSSARLSPGSKSIPAPPVRKGWARSGAAPSTSRARTPRSEPLPCRSQRRRWPEGVERAGHDQRTRPRRHSRRRDVGAAPRRPHRALCPSGGDWVRQRRSPPRLNAEKTESSTSHSRMPRSTGRWHRWSTSFA